MVFVSIREYASRVFFIASTRYLANSEYLKKKLVSSVHFVNFLFAANLNVFNFTPFYQNSPSNLSDTAPQYTALLYVKNNIC